MGISCAMEQLEARVVLSSVSATVHPDVNIGDDPEIGMSTSVILTPPPTGAVTGRVFDDVNGNGTRDAGEKFMAGVSVTVDVPYSCDFSGDDVVCAVPQLLTRTDAAGKFRFDSVSVGQRHVGAFGEGAVYADSGSALVMVAEGETSSVDIPVRAFAVISGRVLRPGRRAPVAVVGARVFLDQNNNGKRDRDEMR